MAENKTFRGFPATFATVEPKALEKLTPHKACVAFPPLDDDSMETLTTSISKGGFDSGQPIVVWKKTGELVEGRHRRDIMVNRGEEAPVVTVAFPTERDVIDFVVAANLGRRHLNAAGRKAVRHQLHEMGMKVGEIAKVMNETPSNVSHSLREVRSESKAKAVETLQKAIAAGDKPAEAAKKAGVSASTARRVASKPKLTVHTGGKAAPVAGPAPKFDPKAAEAFKGLKVASLATAFQKAVTRTASPIPVDAQQKLAADVVKGLTAEQKGDKAKGEAAIAAAVEAAYPVVKSGNVVSLPVSPHAVLVEPAKPLKGLKKRTVEALAEVVLDLFKQTDGKAEAALTAMAAVVALSLKETPNQGPAMRVKTIMAAFAEAAK